MDTEQYYVWWTSQRECERIGDALVEELPEYIRVEYRSRLGRNGRGRLWVHKSLESIKDKGIEWDTSKPAAALAEERGGIVIRKEDSRSVFFLPGFLTDMHLNFINAIEE